MPTDAEMNSSCAPRTIGCASVDSSRLAACEASCSVRDAVEQHDEFVAALAAHVALEAFHVRHAGHVVLPQAACEALRDDAQQIVADRVAQRVVDPLEVIEVQKHDRERLAVALRGFERLGELFVKPGAVGQLGEHVEIGQPVNLLDRPGAFGRVLNRSRHADDASAVSAKPSPKRCTWRSSLPCATMRRSMPSASVPRASLISQRRNARRSSVMDETSGSTRGAGETTASSTPSMR